MGNPGDEGISFEKNQSQQAPPDHPQSGYGQPGYGQHGYPPQAFAAPPGYGQPGWGYGYQPGPPPGPKPSSNIGWAIAAIFLFWPLCIPAFIFSSRVDGAWFAGDYYGAQKASADARKYGMIGVIVGGSLWVLYILFVVVVFGVVIAGSSHVTHTVSPYGN